VVLSKLFFYEFQNLESWSKLEEKKCLALQDLISMGNSQLKHTIFTNSFKIA